MTHTIEALWNGELVSCEHCGAIFAIRGMAAMHGGRGLRRMLGTLCMMLENKLQKCRKNIPSPSCIRKPDRL